MKNLVILAVLFCIYRVESFSQFEIKTNPIPFIFKIVNVDFEYGIKPNLGIELGYQGLGLLNSNSLNSYKAHGLSSSIRHYFVKDIPLSRFYVGAYSFFLHENLNRKNYFNSQLTSQTFGVSTGYKLLLSKHWFIEGGLQFGKRFIFKGDQILEPRNSTEKFFYKWDLSLRFRFNFRF